MVVGCLFGYSVPATKARSGANSIGNSNEMVCKG